MCFCGGVYAFSLFSGIEKLNQLRQFSKLELFSFFAYHIYVASCSQTCRMYEIFGIGAVQSIKSKWTQDWLSKGAETSFATLLYPPSKVGQTNHYVKMQNTA